MMMTVMRKMMCMNPMWMWPKEGCGSDSAARRASGACMGARESRRSIVETAAALSSFRTLSKALEASGLGEILKGDGPFTVFAPTDDAFSMLPAGALEELLKPESRNRLISVLKYHVAPGRILSSEIARLTGVRTFSGRDLAVRTQGGVVLLDNALVVKADQECTNGVIHVIDGVLLPS